MMELLGCLSVEEEDEEEVVVEVGEELGINIAREQLGLGQVGTAPRGCSLEGCAPARVYGCSAW
jgi:hypothetical protein